MSSVLPHEWMIKSTLSARAFPAIISRYRDVTTAADNRVIKLYQSVPTKRTTMQVHQPLARAPCMYRAAQLCSLSKQLFYLYVCACTPFVCSSTSVMGYTNLASPPHPIWSCQAWQRSESKSGHSMHRQSYQWDMKCAVLGATNGLDLIRLNSERHHLHSHVGPLKGTLTTSYTKQKRKFVKSHMCIHGKNCLNCWYYKKCMHTELQHKLKTKVTTTIKVIIVLLSYN